MTPAEILADRVVPFWLPPEKASGDAATDSATVLELRPPTKSRAAVIEDIRRHGPPVLAVVFSKGALDIAAWICCTDDEVVLNGPAGPEEAAAMEDVALVRSLKGNVRAWRDAAGLYRATKADLSLAARLYVATDKLAAATGMTGDASLDVVHRLHRVPNLAYALAAPPDARQ